MAEMSGNGSTRQLTVRHRGRFAQIGIYFGKFLRMFVHQGDWKVLPMSALIAGLVGFALGGDFGVSMEGTLMAGFAIVLVCIWNGSFNSVQVVCRERSIVKREHRSGMYVSSYIFAHMLYQLLLCLLQTVVTMIVLDMVNMRFPGPGLFTPWKALDVGITLFLVTYSSDIMSLWISTLVHSTTTAMTIMPFMLIFQLIFSGGMFKLPEIVNPIVNLTISNPGLKAIASQSEINDLPYSGVEGMIGMVDNVEIGGRVTVGQVIGILTDTNNPISKELRPIEIGSVMTIREIGEDFLQNEEYADLRNEVLIGDDTPLDENGNPVDSSTGLFGFGFLEFRVTVGDAVSALLHFEPLSEVLDTKVGTVYTVGEIADYLASDKTVQKYYDEGLEIHLTLGDAIDMVGREETMEKIKATASESMYNPDYVYTKENVLKNWLRILVFVAVFAALAVITLEFIDKDKR